MTNLDPNPPPVGPRSRTVADRPQTMWMIAAAVAILLVVGYFVSGERTSVVPPAPDAATTPADTGSSAPAATDTTAPAPAPEGTAPAASPDATAPAPDTTAPTGTATTPPATTGATSP